MSHRRGMFTFLLLLAAVGFYRMGAAAEPSDDAAKDRSSEAVGALLESIQQLLANPDAVAEAREELNRQGERLKDDQARRSARVEDLTGRYEDIKQSAEALEDQIRQLTDQLEAARKALASLREKLPALGEQLQEAKKPLARLDARREAIDQLAKALGAVSDEPAESAPDESAQPDAPPKQEAQSAVSDDDAQFFLAKVQPILTENCFECHGTKKKKPKGRLRLSSRASILKGGFSGPAIDPGHPAESLIIQAISYEDPDLEMPPDDKLPQETIDTLTEWIRRGAPWPGEKTETAEAGDAETSEETWAFRPVARPAAPEVAGGEWISNPIDAFILARLEEKGLKGSPPADRRTLIRRLGFNVLGLPPSAEEIEDFANDARDDAYERLVDRMLDSPRYGERWARHWLDVVRFAETNGFEVNTPRPRAWPYRDWVIRAFNEDLPYDAFIVAQLAGDQTGQDEATGFLVGGPWDAVKSPDIGLTLQQRNNELHDMVSTTSAAFLGLTVGCARCHNHKFDPISQKDYYRMQAVFAGVHHGERALNREEDEERRLLAAPLRERLGRLRGELDRLVGAAHPDTLIIDDEAPAAGEDRPCVSPLAERTGHSDQAKTGTARTRNLGRTYSYWSVPEKDGTEKKDVFAWNPHRAGRFHLWLSWGCGFETHARDARYLIDRDGDLETRRDQILLATIDQRYFADGEGPADGQSHWSGFYDAGVHELDARSRILLRWGEAGGEAITADLIALEPADEAETHERVRPRFRAPANPRRNAESFEPVRARFVRFSVHATSAVEPCIDELEILTAGGAPRNVALAGAGAVATASGVYPNNAKHRLEHINDGQYGNERSWISARNGSGWVQIELAEPATIDTVVWGRDRNGVYKDRMPIDYEIAVSSDAKRWTVVASSSDRLPMETDAASERARVRGPLDPESAERVMLKKLLLARLDARLADLTQASMVYAGTFEQPETTHLLRRGDPMDPLEELSPGALSGVGDSIPMPRDMPEAERRMALAHWIANPDNPLTARVMVNRIWHYHFGRGIVATPSDFGAMGFRPSHPRLLDWLAREFIDSGWSVKHIQRLILLSSAFRQASVPEPEAMKVDAGDVYLWRFPPRRLEAEPIRDAILVASGVLSLKMGGPGYEVFEPNDNYVRVYDPKRRFGPAEWRRMIYQFKPRMEQDETFGVFDCPDSAQPQPRRNRSTTPLQALNLLNSPFMLQQAGLFARRIEAEVGGDPESEARRAFRIAFGREPSREEAAASTRLIQDHGLKILCRVLYNANEFVYLN